MERNVLLKMPGRACLPPRSDWLALCPSALNTASPFGSGEVFLLVVWATPFSDFQRLRSAPRSKRGHGEGLSETPYLQLSKEEQLMGIEKTMHNFYCCSNTCDCGTLRRSKIAGKKKIKLCFDF